MAEDEAQEAPSTENEQDSTSDETRPLFSKEEIENTVKGFLLAWVRGDLVIDFPSASDIFGSMKTRGEEITMQEAQERESKNMKGFTDLVEVCSGRAPASPVELEQATTSLFRYIMWWRQSKRIVGKFLEYSIERKMEELERKLEATNRVVIEFIKWYRGSTSGEGVPKL